MRNANLCLDAQLSPRWQMYNGAPLQAWTCSNSDNQNFDFKNDGRIVVGREERYCVDVPNGKGYNGAKLQTYECNRGPNQQWYYDLKGAVHWAPYGTVSDLCIDVTDNRFADGTVMQLYKCYYGETQIFSHNGQVGSAANTPVNANFPVMVSESGTQWVKQLFPTKRLLSWAENDQYYNNLNKGPKIVGLMHWQDGNVAGNSKMWLPQYWGDRKRNLWQQRMKEINQSGKVPPVVLSFNEPDLAVGQNSQASAGMDPYYAAQVHKKEIEDVFRPLGSKIIGPQWGSIWNDDYINKFMGECQKLGCKFDGMGLHMYKSMDKGVDAAVKSTIEEVEKAYAKFKLPLFITELGFTKAGGGSDQQFAEYLKKVGNYLDNTDKVAVWALSAVQRKNNGGWGNDGGFMNENFAFFNGDYSVTDLGYKYMYDTF